MFVLLALSPPGLVESCCAAGQKWAEENQHCNLMPVKIEDLNSVCRYVGTFLCLGYALQYSTESILFAVICPLTSKVYVGDPKTTDHKNQRDNSLKNENTVIIYSPSTCSKPVWGSFLCWAQNKIFWRMLVTKQLLVTSDVHRFFFYFFFYIMRVNGYSQLFGYQHSSKYLLLCSTEERNSCSFGTSWRWVNDKRISNLGEISL